MLSIRTEFLISTRPVVVPEIRLPFWMTIDELIGDSDKLELSSGFVAC